MKRSNKIKAGVSPHQQPFLIDLTLTNGQF
jgi:hypothetical protein